MEDGSNDDNEDARFVTQSIVKVQSFIRMIIKRKKKDPDFLMKKFKIFKVIDTLYDARIERMMEVKKLMARQMVE